MRTNAIGEDVIGVCGVAKVWLMANNELSILHTAAGTNCARETADTCSKVVRAAKDGTSAAGADSMTTDLGLASDCRVVFCRAFTAVLMITQARMQLNDEALEHMTRLKHMACHAWCMTPLQHHEMWIGRRYVKQHRRIAKRSNFLI